MSFSSRQRTWVVGFVAVPVAALVLSACVPPAAPGPAPSAQVSASASTTTARGYWGSGGGSKARVTTTTAPPAPVCNGASHAIAVEQCHLTYRAYLIDTTNPSAQSVAAYIAARITPTQCQNGTLGAYHSGASLNPSPSLGQQYPGASSASENLYCLFFSGGSCPSTALGANYSLNGWIRSPGHKVNMDSIVSRTVNGGGACNPTSSFNMNAPGGVYVAVAQFHNP